jgi:hypothetical protein
MPMVMVTVQRFKFFCEIGSCSVHKKSKDEKTEQETIQYLLETAVWGFPERKKAAESIVAISIIMNQ